MFNTYNPYGYNLPVNNGYQQQRQMPFASPQMASNSSYLKGRVVASIDEVRASQVDLDGSVTYFASPAEGKIYAKGIDMQGLPYIQVYELQQAPAPAMNMRRDTSEMEARIVALENKVKEMESHVQSATNDANAG